MSKLGAVSLLVRDYDEALAFFEDRLGFERVDDVDLGDKRWLTVRPRGGETCLVLALASTDEQRAMVGRQAGERVWLFLETDDFARDHAAFTAAGVTFREPPRQEPYGVVAVFEDLYGNPWDLIEPVPPRS